MVNGKIYESDFEEAFIQPLVQEKWVYFWGVNLHRKITETLIESDAKDFLNKRYA